MKRIALIGAALALLGAPALAGDLSTPYVPRPGAVFAACGWGGNCPSNSRPIFGENMARWIMSGGSRIDNSEVWTAPIAQVVRDYNNHMLPDAFYSPNISFSIGGAAPAPSAATASRTMLHLTAAHPMAPLAPAALVAIDYKHPAIKMPAIIEASAIIGADLR